jgi:hypothetical protein
MAYGPSDSSFRSRDSGKMLKIVLSCVNDDISVDKILRVFQLQLQLALSLLINDPSRIKNYIEVLLNPQLPNIDIYFRSKSNYTTNQRGRKLKKCITFF